MSFFCDHNALQKRQPEAPHSTLRYLHYHSSRNGKSFSSLCKILLTGYRLRPVQVLSGISCSCKTGQRLFFNQAQCFLSKIHLVGDGTLKVLTLNSRLVANDYPASAQEKSTKFVAWVTLYPALYPP